MTQLPRLSFAKRGVQDVAQLAQDFPHRSCRTRDGDGYRLQAGITVQVVEDGSRSWNPLQVLRRILTNLGNLLHDAQIRWRRRRPACAGVGVQDRSIISRGLSQAPEPLFDPAY